MKHKRIATFSAASSAKASVGGTEKGGGEVILESRGEE